jgi:hypothetical protein
MPPNKKRNPANASSPSLEEPVFPQYSDLTRVVGHVLPSSIMDATREHLSAKGALGSEGALCWAGTLKDNLALVTTALIFADSGEWGVHIPASQTGLLYAHCHARGLTLLAQVHSHPGPAFHSPTDERLPHSAEPGFLSLVVPNFGDCSFADFRAWAVFEQTTYERWRAWPMSEKTRRLRVLDSTVRIP